MGSYLGRVRKRETFYNFEPKYKLDGGVITELSQVDIAELLPESEIPEINLRYVFQNAEQVGRMNAFFGEDQWVVFEFELSDLDENIWSHATERNRRRFKVDAVDKINEKKIRQLEECGIFVLMKKSDMNSDVDTDSRIEFLNSVGLSRSTHVLIELADHFYAGPYGIILLYAVRL